METKLIELLPNLLLLLIRITYKNLIKREFAVAIAAKNYPFAVFGKLRRAVVG